jgi:hypothetical protein
MRWHWGAIAAAIAAALAIGSALAPATAAAHTRIEPVTANIIGGGDAVGSNIGMVAEIQFEDGDELALCSTWC